MESEGLGWLGVGDSDSKAELCLRNLGPEARRGQGSMNKSKGPLHVTIGFNPPSDHRRA